MLISKNKKKMIFLTGISVIVIITAFLFFPKKDTNINVSEKKENNFKQIPQKEPQTFEQTYLIDLTKEDLERDIKQYTSISTRVKKEIIETVLEVSDKYSINPLIIYSLLHAESSMKFFIDHRPVIQKIDNKQIKTNAIGLGGVIWEWHSDDLIKEGIAETKSDLYDPIVNIRATAFVYDKMFKQEKVKEAKTQDESAMLRYFGAANKGYFERIDTKIGSMIAEKLYRTNK